MIHSSVPVSRHSLQLQWSRNEITYFQITLKKCGVTPVKLSAIASFIVFQDKLATKVIHLPITHSWEENIKLTFSEAFWIQNWRTSYKQLNQWEKISNFIQVIRKKREKIHGTSNRQRNDTFWLKKHLPNIPMMPTDSLVCMLQ